MGDIASLPWRLSDQDHRRILAQLAELDRFRAEFMRLAVLTGVTRGPNEDLASWLERGIAGVMSERDEMRRLATIASENDVIVRAEVHRRMMEPATLSFGLDGLLRTVTGWDPASGPDRTVVHETTDGKTWTEHRGEIISAFVAADGRADTGGWRFHEGAPMHEPDAGPSVADERTRSSEPPPVSMSLTPESVRQPDFSQFSTPDGATWVEDADGVRYWTEGEHAYTQRPGEVPARAPAPRPCRMCETARTNGLDPICVSEAEALAAHAVTLGKPVAELTEHEQRVAINMATLAAIRERVGGEP